MPEPVRQAPIRLFAVLLIFGVFTMALSFMIGERQRAYEEVNATVLPAKTLKDPSGMSRTLLHFAARGPLAQLVRAPAF